MSSKPENPTIAYYDRNVSRYISSTVAVDFEKNQKAFLSCLPAGARILDLGCGSGRDTKYFLEHGFSVDATDGSREMCRMASEYTGIRVRQMLFEELDAKEIYDGIWACSSILHVPSAKLPGVLQRMSDALKEKGIVYTSFKYGTFEGMRNGRYFTDLKEDSFEDLLRRVPSLRIIKEWVSTDVRPGREDEKWLNLILQKS
jgi:SAM-dependent methyltransferase